MRATAARALREHGYLVDETTDAEEALRCFEKNEGNYDLVFIDVILPGQNGDELAEVLLSRKPDLHIVLTSTWLGSAHAVRYLTDCGVPFVEKLYKIGQVLKLFREQLAGR